VHITEIDQWSWVSNLALFEEVSYFDRVIAAGLTDDTLNFFEVTQANTAFNILEVDVLIFSVR